MLERISGNRRRKTIKRNWEKLESGDETRAANFRRWKPTLPRQSVYKSRAFQNVDRSEDSSVWDPQEKPCPVSKVPCQ